MERYSYSWKKLGFAIGAEWGRFKREMKKYTREEFLGGLAYCLPESGIEIERWAQYKAWEDLLVCGECFVAQEFFAITEDGKVVCF